MASSGRGRSPSWQARLEDHCRSAQAPPPVFNIVSDRRGGRTAWSSTVTIPSSTSATPQTVQARFWYDGQYVHNAREDAAEVALQILTGGPSQSPTTASNGTNPGSSTWGGGGGSSQSGGSAQAGSGVGVGAAWPRSPPAGRW